MGFINHYKHWQEFIRLPSLRICHLRFPERKTTGSLFSLFYLVLQMTLISAPF